MDEKGQAYAERERALLAYLDYRIPQLHDEGKAEPGPLPGDATLYDKVKRADRNLKTSKYPGRLAREVAEREFAEGARAPE